MSVLAAVSADLDAAGVSGYRREIAEALAASLDSPDRVNAAAAVKLDGLMRELTGGPVAAEVDRGDELAAKREKRRAAAKRRASRAKRS